MHVLVRISAYLSFFPFCFYTLYAKKRTATEKEELNIGEKIDGVRSLQNGGRGASLPLKLEVREKHGKQSNARAPVE